MRKSVIGTHSTKEGKDADFIHGVPDSHSVCALNPSEAIFFTIFGWSSLEQLLPPAPALWIEEVYPRRASRPAPTFVLAFSTLGFDEEATFGCFLVNGVV